MEADGVRVTSNFQAAGEDSPGSRLALFSLPGSLAVLAVFTAAAWTGQSTLTLLCGLILSAAVVVRLWSALSLLALDYRRELSSTHAFPGDTVTLSLTVANRKWLPLGWAGAQERIP